MNQSGLIIPIVIVLVLLVGACTAVTQQPTNTLVLTQTPNMVATANFERTAIARFTENPEFAASITPFYGEILWNEAIRQITETPVFEPDRECYLVADYWQLYELRDTLFNSLEDIGISATIEVFVSVVWHSSTCGEYLVTENTVRVWIDEPIELESDEFFSKFLQILDILIADVDNAFDISTVPSNVNFAIFFDTENERSYIETNRLEVSEALENNLTGDALLEHLGGLKTINNP